MVCLRVNPILHSPWKTAIVTGCIAMLYFGLMSYSPYLPPALLTSVAVSALAYILSGGVLGNCQETPRKTKMQVPQPIATLPLDPTPKMDLTPVRPISAYNFDPHNL
jgi:hypothetical protein